MDFQEYRKRGKEMVDYIADYLENIRDRRVFPDVKPGYMHNLLPESAPLEGEKWENIVSDIERVIMPGITHWQSPHMHAYFPALNSFPSMLGDMLADAINCLGFTWASSPACTELETIVMNWLGKMIGLPDEFLHLNSASKGGGVIQTTASESTLVCLLAGRTQAIKKFHERTPGYQDAEINARLVAYCSDQAHSSVEKAALIGLVRMRYIESTEELIMCGKPLREAIENDIKQGLIPFWVCCTLGTTGACAFDNLDEIGNVCREFGLWLHIDAAYAGSALICPEYRLWLKGVDKADSIAFNPSKWLMVHFDCTAMWVKDSTAVHRTFNVEPLYLQHENSGLAIDYMHWQIPLSKRFRALKLWFVLRSFGIKGLQKHIREGVRLAQKFEALVLADHRFEIPAKRHLGMVVFRIKGENELTEKLLKRLNHRGKLHCVPASLKGKYIIRFTVTSTRTTIDDILEDWNEIKLVTAELLDEMNVKIDRAKVSLKDTKEKNEAFGSSLLLSNSPMSPKVVNGSFAAIFDADEFLAKTYAGIRIAKPTTSLQSNLPPLRPLIKRPTNFDTFQHQDSPSMRRRVRGILMSGKQFSLDSRMDLVCYDNSTNDENKANPIREDSEEVLEAFESPGTPPVTPPPRISPMVNRQMLESVKQQQQMQNLIQIKFMMEEAKLSSKSTTTTTAPSVMQTPHQHHHHLLTPMTPTNSIEQIAKANSSRTPNRYKKVDNFTTTKSKSLQQSKTQTTNATTSKIMKQFLSVNHHHHHHHQAHKHHHSYRNSFDVAANEERIISQLLRKHTNDESNCRNCNLSLNLTNETVDEIVDEPTDSQSIDVNEGDVGGGNSTNTGDASTQSGEQTNLDFKSTVNTITVKQNINLNANHKNKLHNHSSKNKHKALSVKFRSQEEEIPPLPLPNNSEDDNDERGVTMEQPLLATAEPPVYHGKRFLEQTNNDGIFAFYNLAFKAASAFQQRNSMSDISEEEISVIDSVDWEAVKTNFNKTTASPSFCIAKSLHSPSASSTKSSMNQQKMILQFLSSSKSSTESLANDSENEMQKPLLAKHLQASSIDDSKAHSNAADEKCIATSIDSITTTTTTDSLTQSADDNDSKAGPDSLNLEDPDDANSVHDQSQRTNENEENDDDTDDEDDDDDDDDEESKAHSTTASSTSSSQTSKSCVSQPINLWSSLEFSESAAHADCKTTEADAAASNRIQIAADGWTIVEPPKSEILDAVDICHKCGHNSAAATVLATGEQSKFDDEGKTAADDNDDTDDDVDKIDLQHTT